MDPLPRSRPRRIDCFAPCQPSISSIFTASPQVERLQGAVAKLDVLVRQKIDLTAPPHHFTRNGRTTFDALLQSKSDVFAGNLFVGDVTFGF